MSKASELRKELARVQRTQARLMKQVFLAIEHHGSERARMALRDALKLRERATELMAEADEAIGEAVDVAVQDEEDDPLTDEKVIAQLAKRAFPGKLSI